MPESKHSKVQAEFNIPRRFVTLSNFNLTFSLNQA